MQITDTVSVSTKNFSKNNTPPLAGKIGNILLTVGVVGTAIVGLPMVLPATIIATIPAIVFSIGGWGMALGIIGKAFTKTLGKTQ